MTRDHFPVQFLLPQQRFFIISTQESIKIICHYSVTLIIRQEWWYRDGCLFVFSSFLSSDVQKTTDVTAALLALRFQMLTRSAGDSKQVLLQARVMIKTNGFQSHQRPGELRWIQSQATASVKCLANKNILYFLHINGLFCCQIKRTSSIVTTRLLFECAGSNMDHGRWFRCVNDCDDG